MYHHFSIELKFPVMNKDLPAYFFEYEQHDEIAVIRLKNNVFDFISDIDAGNKLISFFDELDYNPGVKGLLFYNDADAITDEKYDGFMNEIMSKAVKQDDNAPPDFSKKNARFREINILDSIIKQLAKMQLIIVSGVQGTIVTPFIGTVLVADFRYATEDAVFSMAHNRYGLHPSGGLPFFLSNIVHHSKALEIQMSESFTAQEAMEMGLINKVFPVDDFEQSILNEVKQYTKLKYSTIRDTKRLTNFTRMPLDDYFDFETGLLNL